MARPTGRLGKSSSQRERLDTPVQHTILRAAALTVILVLLPACSRSSESPSNGGVQLDLASEAPFEAMWFLSSQWINTTGLVFGNGFQPEVEERMIQVCEARIWEESENRPIAVDYITQDRGDPEDEQLVRRAMQALWLAARRVCGDDFPVTAIEAGPPGFSNSG